MKPRSCVVRVWISDDAGKESCYSLRPLGPEQLAPAAVAGFRLVNLSADPPPAYFVSIHPCGQAGCNCPQGAGKGVCEHADALTAAGILPSALLGLLQERTLQWLTADAESQRLAEAAVEERKVHEHDALLALDRIAELSADLKATEEKLAAVSARAVQLQDALAAQQAARPRRRAVKAKAAA